MSVLTYAATGSQTWPEVEKKILDAVAEKRKHLRLAAEQRHIQTLKESMIRIGNEFEYLMKLGKTREDLHRIVDEVIIGYVHNR